jgi:hypothetical protein
MVKKAPASAGRSGEPKKAKPKQASAAKKRPTAAEKKEIERQRAEDERRRQLELLRLKQEKIRTMIIEGASHADIVRSIGEGAAELIESVIKEIVVPDPESATKIGHERLAYLSRQLMPKAETGNEVAINAVVKIIQVQQQLIFGLSELKRSEAAERARIEAEKEIGVARMRAVSRSWKKQSAENGKDQ